MSVIIKGMTKCKTCANLNNPLACDECIYDETRKDCYIPENNMRRIQTMGTKHLAEFIVNSFDSDCCSYCIGKIEPVCMGEYCIGKPETEIVEDWLHAIAKETENVASKE